MDTKWASPYILCLENQFGFRAKHSTAEALHITRRIQDYYESSGSKFFMLFLDWSKAFDKIDQTMLLDALRRLNLPDKIIRIIGSLYSNPQFRIQDSTGNSNYYP